MSPRYGHRQPEPAIRKSVAETAIGAVFTAIYRRELVLDEWVKDCLAHAIGADWRGLYDLSQVEAKHALAPPRRRSPYAPAPASPPMTLAQLERAFTNAQDTPVRQHPVFG